MNQPSEKNPQLSDLASSQTRGLSPAASSAPPDDAPKTTQVKPAVAAFAGALAGGALVGLLVLLFKTLFSSGGGHTGENEVPFSAFLVAGCSLVVGIALIWISRFFKNETNAVAHLSRELGMGFIVAFAMVVIIETTLHVHFEKRIVDKNAEITGITKQLGNEQEKLGMAQGDLAAAQKKLADEHAIRAALTNMLQSSQKIREINYQLKEDLSELEKRNLEEMQDRAYQVRLKSLQELSEKKVQVDQLQFTATMDLDSLGLLLMRKEKYNEAELLFKNAEQIDRKFARLHPNVYYLRTNLVVTFSRLASAQQKQNKFRDVIRSQSDEATEWALMGKQFSSVQSPSNKKRMNEITASRQAARDSFIASWKTFTLSEEFAKEPAVEIQVSKTTQVKLVEDQIWKVYRLKIEKGKTYKIDLRTDAKDIDPLLMVHNTTDSKKPFLFKDDIDSSEEGLKLDGFNSRLEFTCPQDGDCWVIATTSAEPAMDRFGKTGELALTIAEVKKEK